VEGAGEGGGEVGFVDSGAFPSLDPPPSPSLYGPMFSIPSFPKLIVLIGIITAIWYGFRVIGALDRARRQADRMARQAPGGAARRTQQQTQQRRADVANVEDTLKCDGDDPADSARYGLKSALDQGQSSGLATRPAATGLRSM